jgi:iron(III) transport system substrate-binding protein
MEKREGAFQARLKVSPLGLALSLVLTLPIGLGAQGDWKQDWEKSFQAAEKERQINLYICSTCSVTANYERVLEEFKKEHPRIKVMTVTGSGAQLNAREMAERRAGKYLADLHSGGANGAFNVLYKGKAIDPIKDALILPEVVDESKWYGGKHSFIDPDGRYIFAYLASISTAQLFYNTGLVNPKEFKSYYDLLHPKWRGKIIGLDPTNTGLGATMQFFYYHPDLGPAFMRRLFGEMGITYSRDYRQMVDWLARGRFSLCIGCKEVDRARAQGLPLGDFDTSLWKEGASFSAGGGTLSFFDRAPHPNAAKVFINWFLSRKGQIALQRYGNPDDPPNSRRVDIPKDEIPPKNKFIERRRYFDVSIPEYSDMTPIFQLAREIVQSSR